MNRIKRTGALLVAIALIFGVVLQSGIRGVLAVNSEQGGEQPGQVTEQTVSVTEPTAAVTEAVTLPAAEPIIGNVTEPVTQPTDVSGGEEQTTQPTTEPDAQPTDVTTEDGGDVLPEINIYQQLMSCGSLAEIEALLFAEENAAAVAMLSQEELGLISAHIEAICQPTEADAVIKDRLLAYLNQYIIEICPECGGMDGLHTESCSFHETVCPECGGVDGVHTESCSSYEPVCTCGTVDGVHSEDCPAYEPVCTCGSADGIHAEDCPLYEAETESYIWAELSDAELAAWLMDEANAEAVKAILKDETTEEYAKLTLRIEAILSGEDVVLAEQLMVYLTALVEMDETETLTADEYIYFDLAAGNVVIGKNNYSGYVYVTEDGTATVKEVTGSPDGRPYYIYQSNPGAAETSPAHPKNTGYASITDYNAKQNCTVPTYDRVKITVDGVEKKWTEYITNNTKVKEVSTNWDTAAAENAKRTGTPYNITFSSESDYTANVIIDNIWSIYRDANPNKDWRTSGGISANLNNYNINCENVNIYLRMKGDNRVGCVHYSAGEGRKNSINFINGDSDETPGSITVVDLKDHWSDNHWCAVIGGADSPPGVADKSDGIVIESGYIYAGATFEDNCTAIGGGGNDYGGVTIKGGTVTAVTGGTGTAIGGGIGYGSAGGNTDVLITGGTIYAYNLGLQNGVGDSFANFVPAAAIGGGGSNESAGGLNANITINGGTIYAQSMGGPGIGGGGSATSTGGGATININGGTIIAKSVGGMFGTTQINPGVSIGGGTGATGGGSVNLTITKKNGNPTIRTGSIGGGITTGSGNIGSANVTISGGDITGQVIMKGGAGKKCTFDMSDGRIHDTNVVAGNKINESGIIDPQPDVKISYIEKSGGAVWMDDSQGVTTITGGTIEGCTAYNGGAIFMTGGTFEMSGEGKIIGNTATEIVHAEDITNPPLEKGLGGAVYISGGTVNINGGSISNNTAGIRGGGVYLPGGEFTMKDGTISGNTAKNSGGGIYLTKKPILTKGIISGNTAIEYGGGLCINGDALELTSEEMQIYGNSAKNGGGVAVLGGSFTLNGGAVGIDDTPTAPIVPEPTDPDVPVDPLSDIEPPITEDNPGTDTDNPTANSATNGGGVYVSGGNVNIIKGNIWHNHAALGGGVYLDKVTEGAGEGSGEGTGENPGENTGDGTDEKTGEFVMDGLEAVISCNTATDGAGVYLYKAPIIKQGRIERNKATANGGGMYIYDCLVELEPTGDVHITGNNANNGAGIYIHGTTAGSNSPEEAVSTDNNGNPLDAVSTASPTNKVGLRVSDKTKGYLYFTNNIATQSGGAVCIDIGRFYLETDRVIITDNNAVNGGGVAVLNGNFTMSKGSIGENGKPNTATNGGGVYVSNGEVYIRGGVVEYNTAKNGGGAYVDGGDLNLEGGTFTQNTADFDGGGAYVKGDGSKGALIMKSGTLSGNVAKQDGGGFYVLNGKFTMGTANADSGSSEITPAEPPAATTTAESGEAPAATITSESGKASAETSAGDSSEPPAAASAVAIIGGNTATRYGGGGYVAGDFLMLSGIIGGVGGQNIAENGGGIYVNDGNVTIVYGDIEGNTAKNGGGLYVAAGANEVKVRMLSGTLKGNSAGVNGGGMAVESTGEGTQPISVEIGCLLDHKLIAGTPTYPIVYTGEMYADFAQYDEHRSCPLVENNTAVGIGGGFYMNSDKSTLSFFCVEEAGNHAANDKDSSAGMDVEGGTVIIGDSEYHNHDHGGGKPVGSKQESPRGYIVMDNATLVNGGQVDIYGDMTNPIFREEVTVDIQDKINDHFMDHRHLKDGEQRYKVHYIENFNGTGLYQAYQYDENSKIIEIKGALYSHPGYTILGWYTKPEYDATNPDGSDNNQKFYPVGQSFDLSDENQVPQMGQQTINCGICGLDKKDENLLELYAIWKANGYTVVFDPNVPEGKFYTGEMENQIHQYGTEMALTENGYKYPGNFFNCWNTKPDGSGDNFANRATVLNLTDKVGDTVVLYAQWDPCDHTDHDRWTYTVPVSGTLQRDCSCGGQTLTATLFATDTVYDGVTHPAALILDDEAAWGTDKPEVTYEGTWLNDGLAHTGTGPELSTVGYEPLHAGEYTASIKKTNKVIDVNGNTTEVPVIAEIGYKISKANQNPPEKPTYNPSTDTNKLIVDKLGSRVYDDGAIANAEYCLVYYENGVLQPIVWQSISDGFDSLTLTLGNAYTNYFVEARYEELPDYYASEPARADAVYFFAGNVKVIVKRDDGITHKFTTNKDTDITTSTDGLTMELTLDEDNYYLVSNDYDVSNTMEALNEAPSKCNQERVDKGKYKFTSIKADSTLTITIGTTRKKPGITAQVAPGQVFSRFTGQETTISKDSAFTAAFKIDNFDPYVEAAEGTEARGAYDAPVLKFGSAIPANATIILVDRTDKISYWYYRAATDTTTTVPLTKFTKMGGADTNKYTVPTPEANGYVNLDYQFIVDFSQTSGGYAGESLTMTLEAPVHDSNPNRPQVKKDVTVKITTSGFELTKDAADTEEDLTNSFTCTFNEGKKASKWENRSSALVLTPAAGTTLPPDARIKAIVGSNRTTLYKSGDKFIVPMSLLNSVEPKNVKLTLESALFPKGTKTYSFSAEWLVSASKASKSPIQGDTAGVPLEVTFTSAEKAWPSLKVLDTDRILKKGSKLELEIEKKNIPDGYKITASLESKLESGYAGTGSRQEVTNVADGSANISIPLGGQTPGSYRVMFTVEPTSNDSVDILLEVPYYFVVAD